MAAFGAQLERGRSEAEAVAYIEALFRRISVQDKSARESLQTFAGGKGDVLLAYENEAITAQQKGEELDYVVPDQTILIENPIAVTKDAPEQARAFIAFLRTPESQRVFAEKGYRSIIDAEVDEATYPTPQTLFTIADLGGWPEVQERYFDREDGIVVGIQREIGAPLE
jgi:sulfate transport system substrate-binding protein